MKLLKRLKRERFFKKLDERICDNCHGSVPQLGGKMLIEFGKDNMVLCYWCGMAVEQYKRFLAQHGVNLAKLLNEL